MSWRGELPAACWDPVHAIQVIPVEAEQRNDPVFRATHSQLPMLRKNPVESARAEVVHEDDLRLAVQRQPPDYPIVPILGRSGAGKSHVIRWLRIHLEVEADTHLVFIPKHRTSLRGILERVLERGEGEAFDELRARVNQAVDALADEEEARLRLRNELATLVERRGVESAQASASAEERELRRYLADPQSLPALLTDTWFRETFLGDHSAIARLVDEKLHGRGEEDKEDAYGFEPADFRLSVDDMARAGRAAQDVAAMLSSDQELPLLAAQMLNEQLEPAIRNVFGLGGDDLKELLVELRLELGRRGEQLLVLIEDFSIFQGIQGGLIDAMTLIPSEEVTVCPMRVVLAVTSGYWTNHIPDTVKTRTYTVFDLDVPAEVQHDPAAFVAPYLNAARVGIGPIERAFESGDEEVPNACVTCPVVESCHSAFGDVDGVGLFPFNRPALERAIRSQMDVDQTFIARDVLNRVVRPVLHRDHQAVMEGSFPTAAFANDFSSGAEGVLNIEDEVRLTRSADAPETNERRKRLVRFWSSTPGARNLHPVIHRAYAVPQVEGLPSVDGPLVPTPSRPRKGRHPPLPPPPPPPHVPPIVEAVDRWIETGELQQADRRHLRKIVHSHVVPRLALEDGRWSSSWWTDGSKATPAFQENSILLGDEKAPAARGLVHLRLEGGSSTDARALRALAWYAAVGTWGEVRDGVKLQRIALQRVEVWTEVVRRGLFEGDGEPLGEELVAIVRALELGAQLLGVPESYCPDLEERVAALVALSSCPSSDWPEFAAIQQDVITGRTQQALDRSSLRDRMLRLASFAQGPGGAALALDIPRLLEALKSDRKQEPRLENLPDPIARYLAVLHAHAKKVDELAMSARGLLVDPSAIGGESVEQAVAVVDSLLDRVAVAGLLPADLDRATIRQTGRAISETDLAKVERLSEYLSRWHDLDLTKKLWVLTDDWYEPAERIRRWVRLVEDALARLESHLAGPAAAELEVSEIASRVTHALTRAADAMESVMAAHEERSVV